MKKLFDVFTGEENAIADTLVLNAAVAAKLYGCVDHTEEGVELARKVLSQGKVLTLIDELRGNE